jgi:protein tyrosine phosphatase type 4A
LCFPYPPTKKFTISNPLAKSEIVEMREPVAPAESVSVKPGTVFIPRRNSSMSLPLRLQPSVVKEVGLIISACPHNNEEELPNYVNMLREQNVKHLIRVCDSTYSVKPLETEKIQVHTWVIKDGETPSNATLLKFLSLMKRVQAANTGARVAIHCRTGLGRGPTMAAVALVAKGMTATEAVALVRKRRPGSLNEAQEAFVQEFFNKHRKGQCNIL